MTEQIRFAARFASRRMWKVLGWGGLVGFGLVLLLGLGARIESAVAPVIRFATIIDQGIGPTGGLDFRFTYTKARDCTLLSAEFVGVEPDGVLSYAAAFDPTSGSPATASNRPTGRNVSRPYRLYLQSSAVAFEYHIAYDCGLPWTTRQVVGPFSRWSG